jgi:iron complex transport system substrate-binding protein
MTETQKTRIFYKMGYGQPSELMTFSDALSYIPERNRLTGCVNVAGNLPSSGGWVMSVDPEWLIRQKIDVIVVGDPLTGRFGLGVTDIASLKAHRAAVMALPVFARTSAVKNGRVVLQGDGLFGTPRFIIGFAMLAAYFHPDVFTDLDAKKLHAEYLVKFMRLKPEVAATGIFWYPEK